MVETKLFDQHADNIEDCRLGKDFVEWLRTQLQCLVQNGYVIGTPGEGDHDWGFLILRENETYYVSIAFGGSGASTEPAEWEIRIRYEPGFNLYRRFFHRPDPHKFAVVRDAIWDVLKAESNITFAEIGKLSPEMKQLLDSEIREVVKERRAFFIKASVVLAGIALYAGIYIYRHWIHS